ncbi:MAG: hypothetical protein IT337_00145 [Thermomicrobiales bacterium]|nr:hypothetical protein [Thermomicrobiales bacterium]
MADRTRHPALGRSAALPALVGASVAGLVGLEIAARKHIADGEPFATVRGAVVTEAPPEHIYDVLSDPAGVAHLLANAGTVRALSANRWRWFLRTPVRLPVVVDTVVVDARPGCLISWRTTGASLVPHEVRLDLERPDGANETTVRGIVALFPSRFLPLAPTARLLEIAVGAILTTALTRLDAPSGTDAQPAEELMTDDEQRGPGRVVYSVGPEATARRSDPDELTDDELVTEASEESFPASDPPNYARGVEEHTTDPAPPAGG